MIACLRFLINSRIGRKSKGKRFVGLENLCTFVKHFMDFHLNGGLSPTNKGISAHTGMPFLIEREPQGYFLHHPGRMRDDRSVRC